MLLENLTIPLGENSASKLKGWTTLNDWKILSEDPSIQVLITDSGEYTENRESANVMLGIHFSGYQSPADTNWSFYL